MGVVFGAMALGLVLFAYRLEPVPALFAVLVAFILLFAMVAEDLPRTNRRKDAGDVPVSDE